MVITRAENAEKHPGNILKNTAKAPSADVAAVRLTRVAQKAQAEAVKATKKIQRENAIADIAEFERTKKKEMAARTVTPRATTSSFASVNSKSRLVALTAAAVRTAHLSQDQDLAESGDVTVETVLETTLANDEDLPDEPFTPATTKFVRKKKHAIVESDDSESDEDQVRSNQQENEPQVGNLRQEIEDAQKSETLDEADMEDPMPLKMKAKFVPRPKPRPKYASNVAPQQTREEPSLNRVEDEPSEGDAEVHEVVAKKGRSTDGTKGGNDKTNKSDKVPKVGKGTAGDHRVSK